jgi:hypothetical protein
VQNSVVSIPGKRDAKPSPRRQLSPSRFWDSHLPRHFSFLKGSRKVVHLQLALHYFLF